MDNIPCKQLDHWTENQSPLGSGLNWPMEFTDCGFQGTDEEWLKIEKYNNCDEHCPGYEPMEIAVCEKHGEFIKDFGCDGCMYDDYMECQRSGEEYYSQKAGK